MKSYALYNKSLKKTLHHPRVGLWFTTDLEEAKELLVACREYLDAVGGDKIVDYDNFVIIDAETKEEILI